MKQIKLFFDKKGNSLFNTDLLKVFEKLDVHDCDLLYIHSSLSFGMPNPELKRLDILEQLFSLFSELNVPTLCMPVFTFSFCNGKIYDPLNSKSKMGAFNEFFRIQNGAIRSVDPLMSVALIGKDRKLVTDIGNESVGRHSNFDLLRQRKKVKFLFLGTKIGDCFTYMHYLEWLYKVDYRYNRIFKGVVVEDGKEIQKEYILFVRYNGVLPNNGSYIYEQKMYDTGIAKQEPFGDSTISIVEESVAADCYKSFLDNNPYFFVDIDSSFKNKDQTFILEKEMVAL